MTQKYPKRLIEVDLPIKRISAHARREKSIRHGHISTLHIWWARRPLAACRAVICAALWPDPADELCPASFRDRARTEMLAWTPHERQRLLSEESRKRFEKARQNPALFDDVNQLRGALLDFIADFANWDNSTVKEYLETSRALTQSAHEALGGSPGTRPLVVDPFAGGGAIPIEASRIGTDTFANDLNPIAVLLNIVALELIPRYGKSLLEAVRIYGEKVEKLAWQSLAELYPTNPDSSTTIAWLWGRTVQCEGPACGLLYPIVGQTWISRSKDGNEEIHLRVVDPGVECTVVSVKPGTSKSITTSKGSSAICPRCQFVMKSDVVQRQLSLRKGGAADAQLLAVVCRSADGRTKFGRSPTIFDHQLSKIIEKYAQRVDAVRPRQPFPVWDSRAFVPGLYGVTEWGYMHTPRQILSLATFAASIKEVCASLEAKDGEFGKTVRLLLALCLGRLTDTSASTCRWVAGTPERGGSFIAAANGGEKHLR